MPTTMAIGNITLSRVISALVASGHIVSVPLGDGHPYDLIADIDGRILRIQCKTGKLRDGYIYFSLASNNGRWSKGKGFRSYQGKADAFGVHCPQLDKTYLVPIEDVGVKSCSLRLTPPNNGRKDGIRWAATYEIG